MAKVKHEEEPVQVMTMDDLEAAFQEIQARNQKQTLKQQEPTPSEQPLQIVDKIINPPKPSNDPYGDYINPFWSTTNLPPEFIEMHVARVKLTYSIKADLIDMGDTENSAQEFNGEVAETMARRSGGFHFYDMLFTRVNKMDTKVSQTNPLDDVIRKA